MARRTAVSARGTSADAEALPPASPAGRIGWLVLLLAWMFVVISLISFDAADPPSTLVAVHHDPPVNLCGVVGATLAWHIYATFGFGVWVVLVGVAAFLGVRVTGRRVTHPFVRGLGLLLMALAVSSFHGLLLPRLGPLGATPGGVVAQSLLNELTPRFSVVGTALLLLAGLMIGALVAIDRLLILSIIWLFSAIRTIAGWRPHQVLAAMHPARWMFGRRVALAGGGRTGRAAKSSRRGKAKARSDSSRRKNAEDEAPFVIDPDAGGLGGVESFDPEAEADDEDVWEYEDEEGDEYDEEDAPEADEAWEYEDEVDAEDEGAAEGDDEVEEELEADAAHGLTAEELRAKIAKLPVRMGRKHAVVARDEDIPREENFEGYQFPTLELLEDPETNYTEKMEEAVRRQAEQLEQALQTYDIDGEVVGIESGPTVTLYAVELAPGTKVSKVNSIASDLARSLRAENIRIVPNMVGRTSIGIEVPNPQKEKVRLKELMSAGHAEGMKLPMFLGKDAAGEPLVADLTQMPHMLIAGTTGSGKSVCMNTIIMSWLYTKRPDELKLVLVDPKMVELSQFADVPHLMCPVVTEMGRAAAILEWAVNKMEERYELLKEARVRDIASYNALDEEELYELFDPQTEEEKAKIPKRLPFIVFVIDELADLMLTNKEVEQSIVRIAQKARAVGIHLILATQRPQANVVTGLIKSNMPCRVSFKVASGMDSRIVLDQKGAELLLGQGDMMLLTPSSHAITRSQGTLVSDREIRSVAKFLRGVAKPNFETSLLNLRSVNDDPEDEFGDDLTERDPLFDQAVEVMIETGRGSVSLLQRRLAIGYSRASRLVDQMGMAGILGEHKGSVARDVLITAEDWRRMKELEEMEAMAEEESARKEAARNGSNGGGASGPSPHDPPEIEVDSAEESVPSEYDDEFRM